ncbi:MAG: c-type cytochrome domain-containing protein, partial [Planctomycetota bacterium]
MAVPTALGTMAFGDDAVKPKLQFFENHVRPLLAEKCFGCHNAEKQEGGVRLDLQVGMLEGGESGPSVVPGKPEESLLIEAVRYESLEMPPDGPLEEEEIAKLVRWVRQ